MHRLRTLFEAASDGHFPDVDGLVEVHPPERPGHLAVVEFTGHSVVLGAGTPDVLLAEITSLGADGYGGASHPDVKRHLAGRRGSIGTHDALLVARGRGIDPADVGLVARDDVETHPRVLRSRLHRRNVSVFGDREGIITIGNGLVGRIELSVELIGVHGRGAGRRLIAAGLDMAPIGPVWAQVAPGNAASLRAFLASGFQPVGAETLIHA